MGILSMAKINKLCVGESLVGDGNEVAHIDLIIGPRGSAAETAFATPLPTIRMVSPRSSRWWLPTCSSSPRPFCSTR